MFPIFLVAQTITGRLINQNGIGLPGLDVKLYISSNIYQTTSVTDGSFIFDNVTKVRYDELPAGYSVTNNYPNPFNPRTRIGFTLPSGGDVNIVIYNVLGQKVRDEIQKIFSAGNNYIDLELSGLPNGLYIARITLNNIYVVTKKMMLLYGSQHLNSSSSGSFIHLNKLESESLSLLDIKLDSLVVTGASINKKIFDNLPVMKDSYINLGNLEIQVGITCQPSVTYLNKTYNVVKIGEQCWLKENLDVGTMIPGSQTQSNNGIIEKYCFNNNAALCNTQGGLYRWDEAMQYSPTEGAKGICPPGFHIPSHGDFLDLTKIEPDGNAWKALNQDAGPGAGTNTTGFSALISGLYSGYNQTFLNINVAAYLWSSTENQSLSAVCLNLTYYNSSISFWNFTKDYGMSIRCVKTEVQTVPPIPKLKSPVNNLTGAFTDPLLTWYESQSATIYSVQVSTNSSFTNIVRDRNDLSESSLNVTGLTLNTTYYWRVRATNNKGTSAWSSTWAFKTVETATGSSCPGIPSVIHGDKTYQTVFIGTKCWLKENINLGTRIIASQEQTDNGEIEKYCYNNEEKYCDTYGGLYQWSEAMTYKLTPGGQGICPQGWHIPTVDEFNALKSFVNYDGNVLKAVGQGSGDGGGNNLSGFSALLAGNRNYLGVFNNLLIGSYFWSSTEGSVTEADGLSLYDNNSDIFLFYSSKKYGVSVRCLKN